MFSNLFVFVSSKKMKMRDKRKAGLTVTSSRFALRHFRKLHGVEVSGRLGV